jgi:UDP-glucose 4-epimerase
MSEKLTHACVTGGAGFIGSHLVRALLARGMAVTVLDNLSVGRRENVPAEAALVEGDILDAAAVDRALQGCDVVFHLAARVAIRSSFDFVVEDTMTNVSGSASVLAQACGTDSVRRLLTASSMAVYADAAAPAPVNEQHDLRPVSPYGVSKLAAEHLTHTMCAAAGKESMVLRLFNTYGRGQAFSPYVGVVTIFVNKLHSGQTPQIFGDGEQCRDFVHVEDVVTAFVRAMDSDATGETLNVGTGKATSINAVYAAVSRGMGSEVRAEHTAAVPGEVRYSIADIEKARRLIGYQPKHVFENSVNDVVQDILGMR